MATSRGTTHMAELNSLHSTVSHEAINLTVQLRAHETSYSYNIQTLAKGLKAISRGQATVVAALDEYHASEED